MTGWSRLQDVRTALHIQPDNKFNSADNGVGMNYTLTEPNVLPIYEHARAKTKLRVLVYNGDTDPGINSMVTQSKCASHAAQCLCSASAVPRSRGTVSLLAHLGPTTQTSRLTCLRVTLRPPTPSRPRPQVL